MHHFDFFKIDTFNRGNIDEQRVAVVQTTENESTSAEQWFHLSRGGAQNFFT